MRVVEQIDEPFLRRVRQPVRVDAQRDRGVLVTKLPGHVRDGRAILQQERRERVPHLVRAAAIQPGGIQHLSEGQRERRDVGSGSENGPSVNLDPR